MSQLKLHGFDASVVIKTKNEQRTETFVDESTGEVITVIYKENDNHLYIMMNELGIVKIGRSYDPENRRKVLEQSSGLKIWIINIVKNAEWFETRLHNLYNKYRTIGEWFNLPKAEIEWLERIDIDVLKAKFQ